jgi:TetR/AcrR family transcriptional repressor of nem operon
MRKLLFSEMTDSETLKKGSKRERLVSSARELMHQQGVERTTLAEVAHAADVPPGNVYYYFKTKDELVEQIIDAELEEIEAMLASLELHPTPEARLKALIRALTEQFELAAQYGCAHGSLCQELDKRDDDLRETASNLMAVPLAWVEQQFRLMGRGDARDLAVALVASYQGISLITNTFRDPELMLREASRLEHWIDSLA